MSDVQSKTVITRWLEGNVSEAVTWWRLEGSEA